MTSSSRVSVALVSALSAVGLFLTAPAPASATTPTLNVSIAMFAFSPSNLVSPLGDQVKWTNNDSVQHTSTSNQGFWASPVINPGTSWTRAFNQAGTFAYHCAIHTSMHGMVSVPMRVSPRTGGGTLVWSLAAGSFDVQILRPGTTLWAVYRSSTTTLSATFSTTRKGTYHFRARTHHSSSVSGWSPSVALSVS